MPALRTELTEIITGLGMLSEATPEEAVQNRPSVIRNVEARHWERLADALKDSNYRREINSAWENGRAFFHAKNGLRERRPLIIEWKGPHHPPGYDFLPADLRIDHVFLVSCKYLSRILANVAPAHLFHRALAIRDSRSDTDWFMLVAEKEYRQFYASVRTALPSAGLPANMDNLSQNDRQKIKKECARTWPGDLGAAYRVFSEAVSRESARIWNEAVSTRRERELLLWRILRFNPAPYFILGSTRSSWLRLRVATPWDWQQQFSLQDFVIEAEHSSQPRIRWIAQVFDRNSALTILVQGHVEIRWSHGRFCGFPEAKIYLDSSHNDVPGYFPL